jgi:hypothetical protein
MASGHFNHEVLFDLTDAESGGYYFRNSIKYYQLAIETVYSHLISIAEKPASTPTEWINKNAKARRHEWIEPALHVADAKHQKRLLNAMDVLETWAYRKQLRMLMNTLIEQYLPILHDAIKDKGFFSTKEKTRINACLDYLKVTEMPGTFREGVPGKNISLSLEQEQCSLQDIDFQTAIHKLVKRYPIDSSLYVSGRELALTAQNIQWLDQKLTP